MSVEPFHLFRYLDEEALRFDERDGEDADSSRKALKSVVGRLIKHAVGEK